MPVRRRLAAALLACLRRHGALHGTHPCLVAISGGVDSTALALTCAMLRARGRWCADLVLATVDHGQHERAQEATDAVVALGVALGVEVHRHRLDLPRSCSEDRLRRARHDALHTIAAARGARAILLAHHADDQVETVLFRLRRGSGSRGLAGIPECRALDDGTLLLRPFLRLRKQQLEDAVHAFGAAHRVVTDPTNADPRPARNALRLHLLPRLAQQHGPDALSALLARADRRRGRADALTAAAGDWLRGHAAFEAARCVEMPGALPPDPRLRCEILRLACVALLGEAPSRSWLHRACRLPESATGTRLCAWSRLEAERGRDRISLFAAPASASADVECELLPDGSAARVAPDCATLVAQGLDLDEAHTLIARRPVDRSRGLFDPERAPRPWRLRRAQPGDRFTPPGMRQDVDLLGHLQRRGVGALARRRTAVLVDAHQRIVWAPQLDVAAHARLCAETRRSILVRTALPSGSPPPCWSY